MVLLAMENSNVQMQKREITAKWRVPMKGKIHEIEFEHGTGTGKRVLWVDGEEIFRRDWMFKLVGEDMFKLEDKRCIIRVDPLPGFKYQYLLFVDGKSYDLFTERQNKALKTWETKVSEMNYRIVLEKESLNVYVNGKLVDETAEFIDGGTRTSFVENDNKFVLNATSSGNKRDGIIYLLTIDGVTIPECGQSL